MNPSIKQDDIAFIPKLKEIIETTSFTSPADYMHKEWTDAVEINKTPSRVLSSFTMKELMEALQSKEDIEIKYISQYALGIATESYRRTYANDEVIPEEQNQFLVPKQDGSNVALLTVEEIVTVAKMKVTSITIRETPEGTRKNPTPHGEYWTATFRSTHYEEPNYYGPTRTYYRDLTVHCEAGVFTWGKKDKK